MTSLAPAQKERQKTARARAGRIREGMRNYIATLGDVHQAWVQEDWKPLGYESWAEYVGIEFSAERLRLPPEVRQKAAEELRLLGMTNRGIAGALNVDERTVRRDVGAANAAPEDQQDAASPARSSLVEAVTGAIEDAGERAKDAGGRSPEVDEGTDPRPASATAEGADSRPAPSAPERRADTPGEVAPLEPGAAAGSGFSGPDPAPDHRELSPGAADVQPFAAAGVGGDPAPAVPQAHPARLLDEVAVPGDEADVPASAADPEPAVHTGSGSQDRSDEKTCPTCGQRIPPT
jgi:hypothetical protein